MLFSDEGVRVLNFALKAIQRDGIVVRVVNNNNVIERTHMTTPNENTSAACSNLHDIIKQ